MDGLRERGPGRQDALAAHGDVVKQGRRVSHAAHGVEQVSQVSQACQRVLAWSGPRTRSESEQHCSKSCVAAGIRPAVW